jgi:enoyl-CoA hydratase
MTQLTGLRKDASLSETAKSAAGSDGGVTAQPADHPTVLYTRRGRVGMIGFNRPEKLNAINRQLSADFRAALEEFTADPEARVGILYGEGRAFCAGADLTPDGPYQAPDVLRDRAAIENGVRTWLRIWECPKPIIAQVHGYCIAGGTQPPLFCDIVAIAEETTVGFPKVPVGGGFISPMWSWRVGSQRARLMSYLVGSEITGREAYEMGYAALIYPQRELADKVYELAEKIARLPAEMLALKKAANNRVQEIQGFRTAVMGCAEWDAIAHTAATVALARDWISEYGLRGAIAKFDAEGM